MKYIIDLDGTLLSGDQPINHSRAFITGLTERKIDFLIMTNSIRSPESIAERLNRAGVCADPRKIINPVTAVNRYIREKGYSRVSVVGTETEKAQVQAEITDQDPQLTVLLDFEKGNIAYDTMQAVFSRIQSGGDIVSASSSPFYLKNGTHFLDTGAFTRLFEAASGRTIPVLGKPSAEYFGIAASLLQAEPEEITVIGDDWSTDIHGGRNAGFKAVLVRSGKYSPGDEDKCPPHRVIDDLRALLPGENG